MNHPRHLSRVLAAPLALLCCIALLAGAFPAPPAVALAQPEAPAASAFAHFSAVLSPGESLVPTYQWLGTRAKPVNLKLAVAGEQGTAAVNVAVRDPGNQPLFDGSAAAGQTLWATLTLIPGVTSFGLANPGTSSGDVQFDVWLYDVAGVSSSVNGVSLNAAATWPSQFYVQFPTNGLYTFTYGAAAGRYQFALDQDYLLKTAEAGGAAKAYVAAGLHRLTVQPDAVQPETDWSLGIAGPSGAADALPYQGAGGNLGGSGNTFSAEWLPIELDTGTSANIKIAATGAAADSLIAYLYTPGNSTPLSVRVYGGETFWWQAEFPAGLNRMRVMADSGNTGAMAYALTVDRVGSAPISVSGVAQAAGGNSHLKFNAAEAGLYDFTYDVTGQPYQFVVDATPSIQKTVTAAGTVRFYLAAGAHDLTIRQASGGGSTAWSLAVAPCGESADALPFDRQGGRLGGVGNTFTGEWLPVYLSEAATANFRLQITGTGTDTLSAALYREGETVPVSTSGLVRAGETFWWTADLAAGLNRVALKATTGNAAALAYSLHVENVAQVTASSSASWQGVSNVNGGFSRLRFDATESATYHFTVNAEEGFASVIVDGGQPAAPQRTGNQATGHQGDFEVALTAGVHQVEINQSVEYPNTSWWLQVSRSAASSPLGHFTGELDTGLGVQPMLPLAGTDLKNVNFRLSIAPQGSGGGASLTVTSGQQQAFAGTVLAGETVWGHASLVPGANVFGLRNTGGTPITYDLTVTEAGGTPSDWAGVSLPNTAWDSAIAIQFPEGGLYQFDLGTTGSGYQMWLGEQHIATTVETAGSKTYYVPAGMQILRIVPAAAATGPATWSVHVSAPAGAADTLPYGLSGGALRGPAGQFHEEWAPIHLASAATANFNLRAAGAAGDALDVSFLTGAGGAAGPGLRIFGGESVWLPVDLPAGTAHVHVTADPANTGPVSYSLAASVPGSAPVEASGAAAGSGGHSRLRVIAPAAGLYDFKYAVAGGRYQFAVDTQPTISKTVEAAGQVRYYLAAGDHDVTIVQDPGPAMTSWSLQVLPTDQLADSLPYAQSGGNLGGPGNPFRVERLPLYAAAGGSANFRLEVFGDRRDAVQADLAHAPNTTAGLPAVAYGGETLWWTAELSAGLNWIDLTARSGNGGPLAYRVTASAVPGVRFTAPFAWAGVARAYGTPSEVEVQAVVSGTYHVLAAIPSGFANVYVDPSAMNRHDSVEGTVLEFDLPLSAGMHRFQVRPASTAITTTWTVTVSLLEGEAPQIGGCLPVSVTNDTASRLTVSGANFQPEAAVALGSMQLGSVTWGGPDLLYVDVPARLAAGVYDLTVTNPDGKAASAPGAVTVQQGARWWLFLPVAVKGNR